MIQADLDQFVDNYIGAWSTTNADVRKELMEKVYSDSARFYANEPGDEAVEHQGLESIFENITQVNERLVIGGGLVTEALGYSENHGILRVAWQMKTKLGDMALEGMNFLILGESGKIEKDYIFIN